ncbi:MAG: YdcF family protein [Kiloniellales bacterium]|nr:YdcF family protein [Kiloniellales bacterium]
MIRPLVFLGFAIFALWLGGLLWFEQQLPRAPGDVTTKVEAVVVLTGGSGRLQQGLDLLSADMGKKLYVSGVYRGVEVAELLRISRSTPEELECCISLGYEADNTRGNALETAKWLQEEGYNKIRLVTASYHMPRSLLEFRRVMPEIEIIAHPVFSSNYHQDDWWRWPGSARLLASEYTKYLIALLVQRMENDP